MNETLLKMLKPEEVIKEKLPAIIDAFVTFYGEEKREFITERLSNINFIFHQNPENLANRVNKLLENYSKELHDEFCNQMGISPDDKKKYIQFDMKNRELIPIYKYVKFLKFFEMSQEEKEKIAKEESVNFMKRYFKDMTLDNYDEYIKSDFFKDKVANAPQLIKGNFEYFLKLKEPSGYDSAKKFAVKFLNEFNPEVNIDNIEELHKNGVFNEFIDKAKAYEGYLKQFDIKMESLQEYINYTEECKNLKNEIFAEYKLKLAEEFSDCLDEAELERLRSNQIYGTDKLDAMIGRVIDQTPLIEAFSADSEAILENGSDWKKSNILGDRVRYFKAMGINLGNDYQAYANNPECQNVIPSMAVIESILKRKNELANIALNKYLTSTKEYKTNREKIDSLGYLLKDDGYDAFAYFNHATFASPNIVMVDGKPKEAYMVCISLDGITDFLDHFIIHELNHIIESALVDVQEDKATFVSGWDIVTENFEKQDEIVDLENHGDRRTYELFSEIINEFIAQVVSNILHDRGVHLFNTEENAKCIGGTSYERTQVLISDFFPTYLKEIVESRSGNNINVILDKVGKDNFDELNSLFAIFNENFTGFKFLDVIKKLNEGVQDEQTILYDSLIAQSKDIFNRMQEYSNALAL